ncbi:MAG TPA: dihydrofolate reductase family protein [Holophagaceae bacterium]|nr:dihydrofolate reductase family protein [Holophagaceae bacterium]
MRTLRLFEHISLDGVIQNSADEDGFPYPDWTGPYRTPEGRDALIAAYGERYDLLLGRRTYDLWSGFWPKAPSSPMADRLNAATKVVVTHRPERLAWGPVEALGPDFLDGVRALKAQEGPDLLLCGSSSLTSPLLDQGLVDELNLIVYPALLGTGKRLFAEGTPARGFELTRSQAFASGVVLNSYKATGSLKPGV